MYNGWSGYTDTNSDTFPFDLCSIASDIVYAYTFTVFFCFVFFAFIYFRLFSSLFAVICFHDSFVPFSFKNSTSFVTQKKHIPISTANSSRYSFCPVSNVLCKSTPVNFAIDKLMRLPLPIVKIAQSAHEHIFENKNDKKKQKQF